ncbi:MAG TPA: hypothetical protein VJ782_02085 [Aeromicrobium sp.]|nr:hypothetical protein [Aeromicrobium sp.]
MTGTVGIEVGWIDHVLAAEFPDLALRYVVVEARLEASPPELLGQLADLSTRFRGRQAIALPTKPVPSAYRAFFRQIGLDPDVHRNPAEAVSYNRIMRGTFRSFNRVADSILATIVETHIALGALDADALSMPLGIRPGDDGVLGLVDADHRIGPLFGSPEHPFEPSARTEHVAVTAVGVAGIPSWMLDHALWRVADHLGFALDSEEDPSVR